MDEKDFELLKVLGESRNITKAAVKLQITTGQSRHLHRQMLENPSSEKPI